MVVNEWTEEQVNRVFFALADRTRRDLLARSLREERSISELAQHYDMSWAAVQKHVAVLEQAGLVVKQKRGRIQLVRGEPDTIERARGLLARFAQTWRDRSGRIADLLATEGL